MRTINVVYQLLRDFSRIGQWCTGYRRCSIRCFKAKLIFFLIFCEICFLFEDFYSNTIPWFPDTIFIRWWQESFPEIQRNDVFILRMLEIQTQGGRKKRWNINVTLDYQQHPKHPWPDPGCYIFHLDCDIGLLALDKMAVGRMFALSAFHLNEPQPLPIGTFLHRYFLCEIRFFFRFNGIWWVFCLFSMVFSKNINY